MVIPVPAVAAGEGRVFVFEDRRVTESSGLVDLGSVMVTTNDSGGDSLLFVTNPATGRTIGLTDFNADTIDVEALAPAGGGMVWVGDIGDNRRVRKSVSVFRVRVGTGRISVRPARYRLVYPRGAHDAESLFTDGQGRLHVITKALFGGTVYRAPLRLSRTRPNRMQVAGRVQEYATDAALLPGGRHVLVRGPWSASVYTLPELQRLGSFRLPSQRQGEGVSVGPGPRIRLSSEGVRSTVRQVSLPTVVRQRMQPSSTPTSSPTATVSTSASATPLPGEEPTERDGGTQDRWLIWSIPLVLVLGGVGIAFGLRRRADQAG